MTLEELKYIVKEACDTYGCGYIGIDDLPEQLTEVEDDEWTDDGKYSHTSAIYKDDQEPPNHFQITNSRSGSYFSGYDYGTPEVYQVKPVVKTVTIVEWKSV